MIYLILLLNSSPSFAGALPHGTSVLDESNVSGNTPRDIPFDSHANRKLGEVTDGIKPGPKTETVKTIRLSTEHTYSNLPSYAISPGTREFQANDASVLIVKSKVNLPGVHLGDLFNGVINQEIKASPSVPTPIRAFILNGNLKGGYFVGEATLDKELKRILIDFTKLKTTAGAVYSVLAKGLSLSGSIGIEGEYHSQAGLFFAGELASATAAGILDSTINRNQTTLGTYVQEPSLSNSTKTGAVTALSKTTDRMAEQTRQAPEYTVSHGDTEIQIIILDEPTEISGS